MKPPPTFPMRPDRCEADPCIGRVEGDGPYAATHRCVAQRTDVYDCDEQYLFCTTCAKQWAAGSIEVANGPQIVLVTRISWRTEKQT